MLLFQLRSLSEIEFKRNLSAQQFKNLRITFTVHGEGRSHSAIGTPVVDVTGNLCIFQDSFTPGRNASERSERLNFANYVRKTRTQKLKTHVVELSLDRAALLEVAN